MDPTHSERKHSVLDHAQQELVARIAASIAAEFEVAMGSAERVREACLLLREQFESCVPACDCVYLKALFSVLGNRAGPIAEPLFELLDELAKMAEDPWPLLGCMLTARDEALVSRALCRTLSLAGEEKLAVDLRVARFFAERLEAENSPFGAPERLAAIHGLFRHLRLPGSEPHEDPITALYLDGKAGKLRRLAARLLDSQGEPASSEMSRKILGEPACEILSPYLAYTRATCLDLLYLAPVPGEPPPCIPGLQSAEALCGNQLLREVLSQLGWSRVNYGFEAQKYVGYSIGGSFPVLVHPAEASLFGGIEDARRTGEYFLFTGHGGLPSDAGEVAGHGDMVSRFRSYNLAHSEVLADILDVAPLTREKVDRILAKMDSIVDDFVALFSAYAEECGILPGIYRELRERILAELERETSEIQLSPELTRLVQMFEDPATIGNVRTMHGLKRYLHQRGLRLGFRLVESGRSTNRTVTLVTVSNKRIQHITRDIQYVNFEAGHTPATNTQIPYPVRVAVEGFGRHILHGYHKLPNVKIFCYGNEVHYYLAFLNHPAFLRIDYSPPLRGGMIDLEYYGVSKHEIDIHPNTNLDCIQHFFSQLEYDVRVENTRVHARYDKERALDLGDICEKAEALFRLAPHLLDIDWVVGSLDLPEESLRLVTEAWTDFFIHWGVLPLDHFLTRNRRAILVAVDYGTFGEREFPWSGHAPYRDRFSVPAPEGLFEHLRSCLAGLGLEVNPLLEHSSGQQLGQIFLEKLVLEPIRIALAEGEIVETPDGFLRSPPELFHRKHEAEFFAEILATEDETLGITPSLAALTAPIEGNHPIPLTPVLSSFLLAHLVAPLERTLRFQSCGAVNGYDVQRATMALCGKSLGLYVLRDGGGIIRLAIFSYEDRLYLRRQEASRQWQSNGSIDATEFAELLWLNNYLTAGMESVKTDACRDAENILSCFRRINPLKRPSPIPGDNLIEGLKASPGRAVGRVLFGTRGRAPEDFHESILVAPSIRPEDNTFLYHSAGVVSVGGGILSHAGLIAIQFRKPALIIAGKWVENPGAPPILLYSTIECREERGEVAGFSITVLRDVRKRERRLAEGDLVVLDSEEGVLRVLGQDREVLSLHESIRHFGEAGRRLARASEEKEILVLRGRRLKARHQIEKHLSNLKDLLLARHVVQELFMNRNISGENGGARSEKARFLSLLLNNRAVGNPVRDFIMEIARNLDHRYRAASEEAQRQVPLSNSPFEILLLHLRVRHIHQGLEQTAESLHGCALEAIPVDPADACLITEIAGERLGLIRDRLMEEVEAVSNRDGTDCRLRHMVRQIQRLDTVLDSPPGVRAPVDGLKSRIIQSDEAVRDRLRNRRILGPEDGGFELYSIIGWKAANLAEIGRLGGRGLVPPWFVVTDRAFQEVLDSPLDRNVEGAEAAPGQPLTVKDAIDAILEREDANNAQKSRLIRQLWERLVIPAPIAREVVAAYDRLAEGMPGGAGPEGDSRPFVAIRSSGREEDTEAATRAGEFDTFLFICGEEPLLHHLKRAWSGLWTERAIHNRMVLGSEFQRAGGGIIVQRNVWSRVSGVLQTINVAENKHKECVINAGLGLGEGIVSGTVAADLIVVAKTENLQNAPLRFRYITSDKRERVVFDARTGLGTVRAQTLYHQRLRPALEYVELAELVRVADRLEAAYGYPLDIEFGIEATRLWILQVRPIGTYPAIVQETVQNFPLSRRSGPLHGRT